jgi:hypothetical protein
MLHRGYAMNDVKKLQIEHFKQLYEKYKGTPMAVSSESLEHKRLRYEQLSKIFAGDQQFSIHDVGMGLSDYYAYLKANYPGLDVDYSGSEIVEDYYLESQKRYPELQFYLRDISEQPFEDHYDYVVMSGLFHQRRDIPIRRWEAYAQSLILNSFTMCKKGVAFNYITPFVDFYQTEVYYCNLPKLLNFIVDHLSRFFVILHNYALFEFTVFVYHPEYIKNRYTQPEFQKYFRRVF